jgi:hypothetical protein
MGSEIKMAANMATQQTALDRLDGMPPWGFTGTLYCVRWLIVLPIAFVIGRLFPSREDTFQVSMEAIILGAILLAPVLETLLECSAPYWIMRKLGCIPTDKRPWGFITVSGVLMMLLHAGAWPAAILPSFVTGGFLAYTYGHFAPVGFRKAFVHTSVFHACINIVGCIVIALA